MEYTVQKLGKLAGISSRTLRYYDEMNFLSRRESIHQDIGYMAKRKSISYSKSCFIENWV